MTQIHNTQSLVNKFSKVKVLVVGDIILDQYIFGKAEKLHDEAPIPIVQVKEEKYFPGGACNVANNIRSLGARPYVIGLVGKDQSFEMLKKLLDPDILEGCVFWHHSTIKKSRVVGNNQQIVRIDYEESLGKEKNYSDELNKKISNILFKPDIVIISDYAKGVISKDVMAHIKDFCKTHKVLLLVDPRPCHKDYYRGVSVITPNFQEGREMAGFLYETDITPKAIGEKLVSNLEANIVLTLGAGGMMVFEKDKQNFYHIPTQAKDVFDVTGAGDTVVAVLALALASGETLQDAAKIANHAAGIVVGKFGTSTVAISELSSRFS